MSTNPQGEAKALPERPNLRHLKMQAQDLVKSGEAPTLAKAQFAIARQYGFASWPKLKAHVELLSDTGELKAAIDAEDFERVKELMTRNPALHRAPIGYNKNGPLTWVAECRVPRRAPSAVRLEMTKWMIEHGSDVHQGGDGPLMRAALSDSKIPMMELLLAHGANVNALWNGNYPIICAPCETLAPESLKWLLAHGADPYIDSGKYGSPLSMVVGTYSRDLEGKRGCLEVFANHPGIKIPDTPAMALHRSRADLLEKHLERDPALLAHHFSEAEIFPPEIGLKPGDGLHLTPMIGGTLLHLAIEYDDLDLAQWLIDRGADVNARAGIDADGFGGHTPLFHCVVTLEQSDAKTRFLLERGADPNARATFRKQLRDVGDPEKEKMREFHNVTPLGYAKQFQEPRWVCAAATKLIAERGGTE
jgi:ankyrin repeat protein